jgi:hypothetical protein
MKSSRLGCFSVTGVVIAGVAILVIAGIAYAGGNALFSPGQLSAKMGTSLGGVASHAEIGQCSACHTSPFSSMHMADRCTACHTSVADEMKNPKTLHGVMFDSLGDRNCVSCHTDHHGSTASLTRISMVGFPHAQLGFSLASHALRTDGQPFVCADCHPNGYASYTCDTCHREIDAAFIEAHTSQYGAGCLGCHDGKESLGKKFDHAQTSFALTGRHLTVQCVDCHSDARSLSALQSTPTECVGCHGKDNPHSGDLGTNCGSCHATDSWSPAKFDHNLARFKLTGQHVDVPCESCHRNHVFAGTPMDCASCHMDKDPHGDVYSTECAMCHTTDAWGQVSYDHTQTGFILDGAHITVTCEQCHDNTPATQMSTTCGTCHAKDDAHGGRFGTDCGACHSTTAWQPATFDHALSSFPLTGAHASLACESCHADGQFAGLSSACVSCHSDPAYHRGMFGTDCKSCHSTSNWSAKYTGPHPNKCDGPCLHHQGASCRDCHTKTLASATCTKCHGSNNPGDGGGGD